MSIQKDEMNNCANTLETPFQVDTGKKKREKKAAPAKPPRGFVVNTMLEQDVPYGFPKWRDEISVNDFNNSLNKILLNNYHKNILPHKEPGYIWELEENINELMVMYTTLQNRYCVVVNTCSNLTNIYEEQKCILRKKDSQIYELQNGNIPLNIPSNISPNISNHKNNELKNTLHELAEAKKRIEHLKMENAVLRGEIETLQEAAVFEETCNEFMQFKNSQPE